MDLKFLCVFIAICVSSTLASASLVPDACKYISEADAQTVSYEFCVSTLGSDPRSSKSTAAQLGTISFELSIFKAKNISSTIDKLLKHSAIDPLAQNALKECFSIYSQVPDDLQAGLQALKDWDCDKANVRVSAAIHKAASCGERIEEKKHEVSSVEDENNLFYRLAAISLGFTKLLRIIN